MSKPEKINLETVPPGPLGPAAEPVPRHQNRVRTVMLSLGPIVAIVGALAVYLTGGRYETTDNAYVKATTVPLTAEVAGPIKEVFVADNQKVEAGQPLFDIDPTPFEIALQQTVAELDNAKTSVAALKASYRQKLREIEQAQSDLAFAKRDLDRQQNLAKSNIVSQARFDEARHAYESAQQKIGVLGQDLAGIVANLAGNPDIEVMDHPMIRQVVARQNEARLNLARAHVVAPIAGVVSKAPTRGQYIVPGTPIFSLVSTDRLWIEANFKETQLVYVRPGQLVTTEVDSYPGEAWNGTVESISQATGAMYSVLPPQNATGNWVKVVQRIPVRIAIEMGEGKPILRAGMSVEVSVDTGHKRTVSDLTGSIGRALGL
jgi:membrane fusion protein, multidrug efflux system